MNPQFVSDLVEDLLPATRVFRQLVRSKTTEIASRVATVSPSIATILRTVGGKCMGYPALWFAAGAVGIDERAIDAGWAEYGGLVLVSLSTSLVDDVLDQDAVQAPETIVGAYYLIFDALDIRGGRAAGTRLGADLLHAIPAFVGSGVDHEAVVLGADRIGAFYGAIGHAVAASGAAKAASPADVGMGSRLFGRWVCLLDDVIDASRDASAGRLNSVPLQQVMSVPRELLGSVWSDVLGTGLKGVIDYCAQHRWSSLVMALEVAQPQLRSIGEAAALEFEEVGARRALEATNP